MDESKRLTLDLTEEQEQAIKSLFLQKGWQLPKGEIDNPTEASENGDTGPSVKYSRGSTSKKEHVVDGTGTPGQGDERLVQRTDTEVETEEVQSEVTDGEQLFVEILKSGIEDDIYSEHDDEDESHILVDLNAVPPSKSVSDRKSGLSKTVSSKRGRGRLKKSEFTEKMPSTRASIRNSTRKNNPKVFEITVESRHNASKTSGECSKDSSDNEESMKDKMLNALQISRTPIKGKKNSESDEEREGNNSDNKTAVRHSGRRRTSTWKVAAMSEKKNTPQPRRGSASQKTENVTKVDSPAKKCILKNKVQSRREETPHSGKRGPVKPNQPVPESHINGSDDSVEKSTEYSILQTKDGKYLCSVCKKTFTRSAKLKLHLQVHNIGEGVNWKEGDTSVKTEPLSESDRDSVEDHEDDYAFTEKVDYVERDMKKDLKHEETAMPEGHKECPSCKRTFRLDSQLKKHINRNCCGSDELIKNLKKETYPCEVCGKLFGHVRFLEYHRKIHSNERPYKCSHCDKMFKTKSNCQAHEALHSEERPFVCSECGKGFKTNSHRRDHEKTHNAVKNEECYICHRKFRLAKELKKHIARGTCSNFDHTPCEVCGKTFNSASSFKRHMTNHSGKKPYVCEECGRAFAAKENLKAHIRVHTGERPYKCKLCPKAYRQLNHLSEHMQFHSTTKNNICHSCGKTFTYANGLRKHIKYGCNNRNRSTICHICNKDLKVYARLKRHLRAVHEQDKRFNCEVCGKWFALKANMQAHQRTHTGEKPFQCADCGKKFSQKQHLREHEYIHTGQKKYHCEECNSSFPYASSLRKHKKLHLAGAETGSYGCKICGRSFRRPGTLAWHMKAHDSSVKKIRYMCENCGKSFFSPDTLRRHKLNESNPEVIAKKKFSCLQCTKTFNKPIKRDFHVLQHFYQKPLVCTGCDKRFYNPTSAKRHMVKCLKRPGDNLSTMQMTCFFCKKGFQSARAFLEHMVDHKGSAELKKEVDEDSFDEEEDEFGDNTDEESDSESLTATGGVAQRVRSTQTKPILKLGKPSSPVVKAEQRPVVQVISPKTIYLSPKVPTSSQKVVSSRSLLSPRSVATPKKDPQPGYSGAKTMIATSMQNVELVPSSTEVQSVPEQNNETLDESANLPVTQPEVVTVQDSVSLPEEPIITENTYTIECSSVEDVAEKSFTVDVPSVVQNIPIYSGTDDAVTIEVPNNTAMTAEIEQAIAQIQAQSGNQTVILVVNDGSVIDQQQVI